MKFLVCAALALLVPQQKNEAEELFKKAEEKLLKAKSVQVKATASAKMAAGEMSLAVEASWDSENRARLNSEMKLPGMEEKAVFISDGANASSNDGRKSLSGKAPPKLTQDLARGWLRGGGFFSAMWVETATFKDPDPPKREKLPECRKFKAGAKEKINGREAHRIEYTGEFESGEVPCVVWIDAETLLPVKREMRGLHGQEDLTLTEIFSAFTLDENIDPAKFELPKEAK